MFFRFGSALVLVVAISLAGTVLEKRNLQLKRAVSRQSYRLALLQERYVSTRATAQQLGAPGRLIDELDPAWLAPAQPERPAQPASRRKPRKPQAAPARKGPSSPGRPAADIHRIPQGVLTWFRPASFPSFMPPTALPLPCPLLPIRDADLPGANGWSRPGCSSPGCC
ncbi:MAG: hypothetical protein ACKV0T_29615 [Planctomycetales bacterium]